MDVVISIDTNDREETITSLCRAMEQVGGLSPEATRPGAEMAVDGYRAALAALMDASDPNKVSMEVSAAFMFAWTMITDAHSRVSRDAAMNAVRVAGLLALLDAAEAGEA